MPNPETLFAFTLASLALIVLPGPSVLFVVGRSLAWGRRAGVLSVIGNGLGAVPLVAAVSVGLGALVAESVVLFTVVKVIGALYLIHLGVQAIRHRGDVDVSEVGDGPRLSAGRALREGFVVGLTNPKTAVFFISVLPQFVDVRAGAVPVQMLVLGLLFVLIALVSDAVWAVAAGTARRWFVSAERPLERVRAAGGAMMIALGTGMLLTGRKS